MPNPAMPKQKSIATTFATKADVLAFEDHVHEMELIIEHPHAATRSRPGGWKDLEHRAITASEPDLDTEKAQEFEDLAFSLRRGLSTKQFLRRTNQY